ncbi:MAG: NADP-dependent oxidoreductase [Alphaproteobacteria bacterium]|nr:MAG: NADP-dependent oxidoreductase [Alphaproteobacteria bacterium]
MADIIAREVRLKRRPAGVPGADDFEIEETALPAPGPGQVLCATRLLSLDPYMRGQISGRHLTGAVNPGEAMRGESICEVVQSNDPAWIPGDRVLLHGHWRSHQLADASQLSAVDARIERPSLALGILGMPGLTAYAGLLYLGAPKAGDTLVVSAAAGAVGSMVGQIGKIAGCRVIGIAGGPEKCAWLTGAAGFDGAIDYKAEEIAAALQRLCPNGIDIYFDNVGGTVLDAAMWRLALGARVVLCGLIAQYNRDDLPPGPNPATIIKARATVRGLVVYDHAHRRGEFLDRALAWLGQGRLHYREALFAGLENAPAAFARLMAGATFGKVIVKL